MVLVSQDSFSLCLLNCGGTKLSSCSDAAVPATSFSATQLQLPSLPLSVWPGCLSVLMLGCLGLLDRSMHSGFSYFLPCNDAACVSGVAFLLTNSSVSSFFNLHLIFLIALLVGSRQHFCLNALI